jgi:hypothetical protein
MEVPVRIEYDDGFVNVGMGNEYTIRMLWEEFRSITHQTWEFGPTLPIRREIDGTVVHGISWEWSELSALINADTEVRHPPKVVEDRGRGTLIRNLKSQGKLLQYWARSEANIEVGVFFPAEVDNQPWNVEYWMNLSLQLVPDALSEDYAGILRDRAVEKISEFSGATAQWLDGIGEFRVETRYSFNTIRFWLCPKSAYGTRIKRPMAEDPSPRDKWYLANGVMAFTFPLVDEVQDAPQRLFGQHAELQERYVDEEVQGGKIALIAFKQMRAQKPPNSLDRMQSTFSKQTAYNQRVLEAEQSIAGINCDVPHFLEDMTADEPVFVCINSSKEMKREEQAVAGQLWVQGDRQMTATNAVLDGMTNTRESVLLCAAAEAVTWNHASQPDENRKGQRVVIFPKELVQLEAFLATSDPSVDLEDGHPSAYEVISRESAKFETPPLFVKEDSEFVANDPILSANVPIWLARSRQVATGGRRRVLEDGRDVLSSSDEDDSDMEPDQEKGMYTAEMDPTMGPVRLSPAQAAKLRLLGKATRAEGFPEPLQSFRLSTDAHMADDAPSGLIGGIGKLMARLRDAISPASSRTPTPVTSDNEDQDEMSEDQKRLARFGQRKAAFSREPADNPTKGQQVLKYPIVPYSGDGSGAGGFRGVVGSGSMDTCVAQGNPS